MARNTFPAQWQGPHQALDTALDVAHKTADRTQRPVSVYEVPRVGFLLAYEKSAALTRYPDRRFVNDVPPNPKAAPKQTWPVVTLFATTDLVQRDVQAIAWREQSERAARSVFGVANSVKPYSVSTGEALKQIAGFRLPLYTLIVRKNPNFPHDKLAVPSNPTPAKP